MTAAVVAIRNWFSVVKIDRVWVAIALLLSALALVDSKQVVPSVSFTFDAVLQTAPFMVLAVMAIGFLKATGSEKVIAQAFQGNEKTMIVLASLVGGMAPFCSCEVIPFVSALLIAGTPLSAVVAFWLSSPLMDPAVFFITSAELGWGFALAKTIVAVALGLSAGFVIFSLTRMGYFQDILAVRQTTGGCCGVSEPFAGKPVWSFWKHSERIETFRSEAAENGLFLLKWLTLAYLLESLMIRYVPASAIGSLVGGEGIQPIITSAFVGAPAYLNGYAAPAIVSGLMEQGMTSGSAMAFMIAGGITSIPAMTAVYALVRKHVFLTYLGLGIAGSILSGILFEIFLHIMT